MCLAIFVYNIVTSHVHCSVPALTPCCGCFSPILSLGSHTSLHCSGMFIHSLLLFSSLSLSNLSRLFSLLRSVLCVILSSILSNEVNTVLLCLETFILKYFVLTCTVVSGEKTYHIKARFKGRTKIPCGLLK